MGRLSRKKLTYQYICGHQRTYLANGSRPAHLRVNRLCGPSCRRKADLAGRWVMDGYQVVLKSVAMSMANFRYLTGQVD